MKTSRQYDANVSYVTRDRMGISVWRDKRIIARAKRFKGEDLQMSAFGLNSRDHIFRFPCRKLARMFRASAGKSELIDFCEVVPSDSNPQIGHSGLLDNP